MRGLKRRTKYIFGLETPEFFDDLFLRLANEQTPFAYALYRLEKPAGARCRVLTPGR